MTQIYMYRTQVTPLKKIPDEQIHQICMLLDLLRAFLYANAS